MFHEFGMDNLAKPRDENIDVVRGIAIFTMVGANMGPLLAEPHSTFFRFYSTFAAPIFVALAGAMVALAASNKTQSRGFSYFVWRGTFLLGVGAMLDMVAWRLFPFVGVDVLYLVGVSLPLWFLAAQKRGVIVFALAILIFALTPIMQEFWGYAPLPIMAKITDIAAIAEIDPMVVLRHWWVDGWFPLFPWFAYGLIGILIGKWRFSPNVGPFAPTGELGPIVTMLGGTMLIIVGAIAMYWFPGPLYSRDGFSELFYPTTLGFIALSFGVVIGLMGVVDATTSKRFWQWFRPLGEASLFMYVFHSLVIGLLYLPIYKQMKPTTYLISYALLIVTMVIAGRILRVLRSNYREIPTMLKWVIGG